MRVRLRNVGVRLGNVMFGTMRIVTVRLEGAKLENVRMRLGNLKLKNVRLESARARLGTVRLGTLRPKRSLVELPRRMTRQGICSYICVVLATIRSGIVKRQGINSSVTWGLKMIA